MEKIKTYIHPCYGEYDEMVYEVLNAHPEWYDTLDIKDFLHTHMYIVLDSTGNLLGFFGNSYWWGGECVLSCVYVYEKYRKQGIFKKIVKYTKEHNYEQPLITIGVMDDNKEAKKVYDHMFKYLHHNEDGHWYAICDRRRNND